MLPLPPSSVFSLNAANLFVTMFFSLLLLSHVTYASAPTFFSLFFKCCKSLCHNVLFSFFKLLPLNFLFLFHKLSSLHHLILLLIFILLH